jgi:hypothetical protein
MNAQQLKEYVDAKIVELRQKSGPVLVVDLKDAINEIVEKTTEIAKTMPIIVQFEIARLVDSVIGKKKGGRLMSRKYCKKTLCRRMGFTQKASCRPYKNCYTRRR